MSLTTVPQRWANALSRGDALHMTEVEAAHPWYRVFLVSSASQANTWYQVRVTGQQVQCSCPAAMHGHPCKHAAKVAQKVGLTEAERVFARIGEV